MCQMGWFTKGTHMFYTWLTHGLGYSSLIYAGSSQVLCVLVPPLSMAHTWFMHFVPGLTHARPNFAEARPIFQNTVDS